LGGLGSKGAIFFHCASVSNGPDRAIRPPSALLSLLISYFQKLNHHHFNGLSTVVQQLLIVSVVLATVCAALAQIVSAYWPGVGLSLRAGPHLEGTNPLL
jgi:uncharacterized membrane protein YagU involved in acid resistance